MNTGQLENPLAWQDLQNEYGKSFRKAHISSECLS